MPQSDTFDDGGFLGTFGSGDPFIDPAFVTPNDGWVTRFGNTGVFSVKNVASLAPHDGFTRRDSKSLPGASIQPTTGGGGYQSLILAEPSLQNFWTFDGTSGTIADLGPGGNALTATGNYADAQTSIPGVTTKAYYLDNAGANVSGANGSPTFLASNQSAFTIEFWVNFNAVSGRYNVVGEGDPNANGTGFTLQLVGAVPFLVLYYPGFAAITGTFAPVVGTWYQIAVTLNATAATIYVNGVSVGTGAGSASGLTTPSAALHFGDSLGSAGGATNADATYADASLYNAVLSPTDILAHYNAGSSAPVSSGFSYMKQKLVTLAASIASSGTLVRAIFEFKAASIASSGVLLRAIAESKAASIASSGALQRLIATAKTASIASSGVLTTIKQKLVTLAASIASSGAMQRVISSFRSATITSAGTQVKSTAKKQAATITSSGAMAKTIRWVRTASIASSGAIKRTIGYLFTASEAASVAFSAVKSGGNSYFQTFTASIASGATLTKAASKGLTAASLSMSASISKSDNRMLTASISSASALSRSIRHSFSASIASAATFARNVRHALSGTLTSSASETGNKTVHEVLTAVETMSGSLEFHRIFSRIFTAILSFVGVFVPQIRPKPPVAQFGVAMSAIAQAGASLSNVVQAGTPMTTEAQFAVAQGA